MEATNIASRGIVQEALTIDNYKRWKTLMKNYLVGKNLWAAVTSDYVPKTKNAEALHIIQISCEPKILDKISHFEKAKQAWEHLGSLSNPELKAKLDIEQGVVEEDLSSKDVSDLYENIRKGNLEMVTRIIDRKNDEKENMLTWVSDSSGRTILHAATMAGHVNVVTELLKRGEDTLLVERRDNKGYTALALAAHYTGNVEVAKCMIDKAAQSKDKLMAAQSKDKLIAAQSKDKLIANEVDIENPRTEIPSIEIPLLLAADKGHKEMTRYLHSITPSEVLWRNESYDPPDAVLLFQRCIKAGIFDVAAKLLYYEEGGEKPSHSWSEDFLFRALSDLAQMPSVFLIGCRWRLLLKIISILPSRKCILGIRERHDQKCDHCQLRKILRWFQRKAAKPNSDVYDAMLHAAKHGIIEFINAMGEANPNLLWVMDKDNRDILSYAVLHRKQNVFQLIYTLNGRNNMLKYRKDAFGNNLLHLAGHLGPSSYLNLKAGAALQMQREIQWFKAVEKVVHPRCKEDKNNDGKKPSEVFTETHEMLVKDGEKWAKEIANSFILVGILITTIMFAAAFTVPGGYQEKTGVPIFSEDIQFTIFIIADAISLFTATISVFTFIVILTSSFAENDFLTSLPMKLLLGIFSLAVAVLFMVVAFCATLSMLLGKYNRRVVIIIALGSFVFLVLIVLQVNRIWEILSSTLSYLISCKKKEEKKQ